MKNEKQINIGEEACIHFIKLMLEMPYSITMSMLATCIETYSEITGISVYNLLATIAEAYEKRKEGGGTNGKNNSSDSV